MMTQSDADKAEMRKLWDIFVSDKLWAISYRQFYSLGWLACLEHSPDVKALRGLAKDHADDWKRIQDAERALEQETARREIFEKALREIMVDGTTPQGNTVAATMAYEALAQVRK
jgi:hypothetical protein